MTPAEEQVAFFGELGQAVTQWANVEHALCEVVQGCFPWAEWPALGVGCFAIENFRSKLEYANRIVARKLVGTPKLAGWDALVKRARVASTARNQLVHRKVVVYPQMKTGRRYALIPTIIKKPKSDADRAKPPVGSLHLRDIIQIRNSFFAVFIALNRFADRVRGDEPFFPAEFENLQHPPSLAQIASRIHQRLGHAKQSKRKR